MTKQNVWKTNLLSNFGMQDMESDDTATVKDLEIIPQLNMFGLKRISKSLKLHLLSPPNKFSPNHNI